MDCDILQVKKLFLSIIDNISEYDDFDRKLRKLDNKDKGHLFELFYKMYFTMIPSYETFYKHVYLYQEIPIKIKNKLKLPEKDKGIDGLVITTNDEYLVVQVKFRKNKKPIPFGELATFPALAFGSKCRNIDGGVLFTNCYDVCDELNDERYSNITYSCFSKCDGDFWNAVREYLKHDTIIKHTVMTPLPHQNTILPIIERHYKENNYGRLYLPCGTGKTFLGYWISIRVLDCNKIFIVVPSLYLLSETYETWAKQLYDSSFKYLLIGSDIDKKDGMNCEYKITTDMDDIKEQLESANGKIVVITTYQSSKLLRDVCKEIHFTFDIGIFDEAHRTTGTNDKMFTNLLSYKKLSKKRLFMTATEKIYHYQMSKLTKEQQENIYSMDNEDVYGKIIYNYSTRKAIEDGQLVDYKVVAPFISSDNYDDLLENNSYITFNDSECDVKILALSVMIIKTMKELNIKHMLIFSNKNEKAKKTMEMIETLLESDEQNIYCKYLNGTDNMNKRRYEVKQFEQSEIGIISSARIFGEGVNIPICDSVCFADNKGSTVDIIQYVGRCLRKCKFVPNKISYVIVPFIMDDDTENFFDSENRSFFKLRRILKSLGTTDDLISEKFVLKDCNKCACGKNDDVNESIHTVNISQTIDLKHFEQSIISKIFDRDGNSESRVRNKIIHENKRRYINGLKLIDTKVKCLKFLEEECETDTPNPDNWIKYCLGSDLFLEIKKKYYYSKEELIIACGKINITDFETYKKRYRKDLKLPSPDYINDGFYQDLDTKFNIITLLDKNNYDNEF